MSATTVTILGSSVCNYDRGDDASGWLVNDRLIVDTGWHLVRNLQDAGVKPTRPKTVLFTHMHQDHYIALPQLLFAWLSQGKPMDRLELIGPHELGALARRAWDFVQAERFFPGAAPPRVTEITPGAVLTVDGGRFIVEAWRSVHPVDGRYYRVTDTATGAVVGFAGDTVYSRDEAAFFKGCDVLVHECALGAMKDVSKPNTYLHSDAVDAANVAREAGVKTLILTHAAHSVREMCLDAARRTFGGEVLMPAAGDVVRVGGA